MMGPPAVFMVVPEPFWHVFWHICRIWAKSSDQVLLLNKYPWLGWIS